jgi:glycosyltransferase involved in cell wall biosynthesis
MRLPSITVLLCTHNDEQTVTYALGSALAQTAPPSRYRVLVVDDGSTDATPRVLESFRERIELVRLPRNRGLAAACNEGLRRIRTPSFVRIDGDDRFDEDMIASLLECREARGADVVVTDRWEQKPTGGMQVRRLGDPPRVEDLIAAGTLLPTGLVRELGGYRDLFWEELDLYMRLFGSDRCRVAHVPRPLYVYRVQRPDQMTADEEAVRAGWEQLRTLWPADALAHQ